MLKLSDNELDKLSREAAEKFEPAENAQSWNKLEQLLDNNLGKPTPIPKTIRPGTVYLYSGAILFAVSFTYFLIKQKKNSNNSTSLISTLTNQKLPAKENTGNNPAHVILNEKKQRQAAGNANDQARNLQSPVNNEPGAITSGKNQFPESFTREKRPDRAQSGKNDPGNGALPDALNNKSETATINAIPNERIKTTDQLNRSAGQTAVIRRGKENINRESGNKSAKEIEHTLASGKNNQEKSVTDKSPDSNAFSQKDLTENNRSRKDHAPQTNRHQPYLDVNDAMSKIDPEKNTTGYAKGPDVSIKNQQEGGLKFARAPAIERLTNEQPVLINDSALRSFRASNKLATILKIVGPRGHGAFINKSLQIGVLFAPEFSEVRHIYQNNRLGNDFGITLSYQLFSKISINSGVVFSKKYYQANEDGFHAPPGTVGNDLDIKFVEASANVTDIPLNVRYNYFSDENSIFFVNAGFSSYLISKQDLNLFCQPNTSNNYTLRYQGAWIRPNTPPPGKNYLFSILNLSTGFETSMGNNFSFQFEPYVKLPVKGIGVGKVDLSSYGINFSLKYAPVLKRGRR